MKNTLSTTHKTLVGILFASTVTLINSCPMAIRNETGNTIYLYEKNLKSITQAELEGLSRQPKVESQEYHEKMLNNFNESFNETVVMRVAPFDPQRTDFPTDTDRFPSHSGTPFYVYMSSKNDPEVYQPYIKIMQKACFTPGSENDRHKILTFTKERKLSLTKPSNFVITPESRVVNLQDQ